MLYLQLFCEFFKTGLFAVGGGLATLPFLLGYGRPPPAGSPTRSWRICWRCRSPRRGLSGVNMATYVGFTHRRRSAVPLVATIGLVAPSVIVILIVAAFLKRIPRQQVG